MKNPFITLSAFVKASQVPFTSASQPVFPPMAGSDFANYEQGKGGRDIGDALLISAGAGAGLRGIQGLWNMLRDKISPPDNGYPQALETDVPIPVRKNKEVTADEKIEDPENVMWQYMKTHKPPKRTEKEEYEHMKNFGYKLKPFKEAFDKQADPVGRMNQWWYLPGMLAATGAGAIGGYKGLDALMGPTQEELKQKELDEAKQKFEQSLLGSYPEPRELSIPKTAAEELSDNLDATFKELEKQGELPQVLQNILGRVGGMYGAYALGTGIPAGYLTYEKMKSNNEEQSLNKALEQRNRRQYFGRPTEIYAVPKPVEVPDNESADPLEA
jgi:hypothetical protein